MTTSYYLLSGYNLNHSIHIICITSSYTTDDNGSDVLKMCTEMTKQRCDSFLDPSNEVLMVHKCIWPSYEKHISKNDILCITTGYAKLYPKQTSLNMCLIQLSALAHCWIKFIHVFNNQQHVQTINNH